MMIIICWGSANVPGTLSAWHVISKKKKKKNSKELSYGVESIILIL